MTFPDIAIKTNNVLEGQLPMWPQTAFQWGMAKGGRPTFLDFGLETDNVP